MKQIHNIDCFPACDASVVDRRCVPNRSVRECRECMTGCLYESLGDLRELSESLAEQEDFWLGYKIFDDSLIKLRDDIRDLIKEIGKNGNS